MTDRPIIFSAPMVQALLAGTKSQTRRVLKPAPFIDAMGNFCAPDRKGKVWNWGQNTDGSPCLRNFVQKHAPCAVGDRLWVREGFAGGRPGVANVAYRAGHEEARGLGPRVDVPWRSPIHMPRSASRLTLTVTAVKVGQLQDISPDDAWQEGVERQSRKVRQFWLFGADAAKREQIYKRAAVWEFEALWNSLHGPDAWTANPWVVAITFAVEQRNIDAMQSEQAA